MSYKIFPKKSGNLGKYKPYIDRLVIVVVISPNKANNHILLTPRIMMALDQTKYVQLGTDGDGRFAIRGCSENATDAYKVTVKLGQMAYVTCDKFVNSIGVPLKLREQNYALIYPAKVSENGWIEVDPAVDKFSIR